MASNPTNYPVTTGRKEQRQSQTRNLGSLLRQGGQHLVILAVLALTFFPFIFTLQTSFKEFEQLLNQFWTPTWPLHFENYLLAWDEVDLYIINSSIVSTTSVAGTLFIGALAAHAFARINFILRKWFYYAVIALLMIPGVLTLIGRYLLMVQMGLMDSLWGLILPYIAAELAFAVFLLTGFFSDLPEELYEAARIDGATEFQSFLNISLPLSKPIMSTVGLLIFLATWGDYVWPLLVLRSRENFTLMLGLANFSGASQIMYGPLMAGYVIASIPTAIIILVMMRFFGGAALVGAFK
jgi:ABC-type glycerol-3-phosphate transport system permease component